MYHHLYMSPSLCVPVSVCPHLSCPQEVCLRVPACPCVFVFPGGFFFVSLPLYVLICLCPQEICLRVPVSASLAMM